jgi:hypothetical protein
MQIIDQSFFINKNYLHIPLAVQDPSGSASDNQGELDFLCTKIEKEILLNALGLTLYNELQIALDDINNVTNAKWNKLVYGDEYDDKVWSGLANENSLIACRVFEIFTTETAIRLSTTGGKVANPENASNATPMYLIANANNSFIKQYQGDYLIHPLDYDNVIDWLGCNTNIERSLYSYLIDKQLDFPTWNPAYFAVYETKNSFGI